MNQAEFNDLHSSSANALRIYVAAAEITCGMLAKCTLDPLPFADRLTIMSQEITENDAHSAYGNCKRLLHDAVRLGYGYC